MTRGTKTVLAVCAAAAAAASWLFFLYGVVLACSFLFDLRGIPEGSRTALTAGLLGAAIAGAVTSALAGYFLVADRPATTNGPSRTAA